MKNLLYTLIVVLWAPVVIAAEPAGDAADAPTKTIDGAELLALLQPSQPPRNMTPAQVQIQPWWEQCGMGVQCLRPDQRCCYSSDARWCVNWNQSCY